VIKRELRPAHTGFIVAVLIASLIIFGGAGSQSECLNGVCRVHYHAALPSLLISIPALWLFFLTKPLPGIDVSTSPVRRRVRCLAFLIDTTPILLLTGPIAVVMLVIEALHTGSFHWTVSRDFGRGTDGFLLVFILILFVAWARYFHRSIKLGEPTIGQYVMGFRVIPGSDADAPTKPALHLFLAAYGAAMWPLTLFLRDKNGDRSFWWNGIANTRAIHVRR